MTERVNIRETHYVVLGSSGQGQSTLVPKTDQAPAADHLTDEFKDGQKYAFKGTIDDKYLDNDSGQTKDGNLIQTWGGNGTPAQCWRAYVDDFNSPPWGYKVESMNCKDQSCVLTPLNKFQNHRVVLKPFNGDREQFWHLVKVPSTTKHQLINASTGRALSNNGSKINCRTILADPNDLHQQWQAELK